MIKMSLSVRKLGMLDWTVMSIFTQNTNWNNHFCTCTGKYGINDPKCSQITKFNIPSFKISISANNCGSRFQNIHLSYDFAMHRKLHGLRLSMDHAFRHASPCLWNQLIISLHQPHSGTSSSTFNSPTTSPITSSSSVSPLCSSITVTSLAPLHYV